MGIIQAAISGNLEELMNNIGALAGGKAQNIISGIGKAISGFMQGDIQGGLNGIAQATGTPQVSQVGSAVLSMINGGGEGIIKGVNQIVQAFSKKSGGGMVFQKAANAVSQFTRSLKKGSGISQMLNSMIQ